MRLYVGPRARMEAAFRIVSDREAEVTLPSAEAMALLHADVRARTETPPLTIE